MKRKNYFIYIAVVLVLTASAAMPQARTKQTKKTRPSSSTTSQSSPVTTAATTPVSGNGTVGQLAKWTGSGFLGNSIITETKTGEIGIGTTTPGSRLTVEGMIESTLGGFKFPDGTIQRTAFSGVFTDETLRGNGTAASPLRVAPLQIDSTLKGNGFTSSLGLAVPLNLSGSVVRSNSFQAVISARNSLPGEAAAIIGAGGLANGNTTGGEAIVGFGGAGIATAGGGIGVVGVGGHALDGVDGGASGKDGGIGGRFIGGSAGKGDGGRGALLEGGRATGAGHRGGTGVNAAGGSGLDGAKDGLAGDFSGDVEISGNLSKGGGSFKIDHPLDPENKYLYHSFVESPDMMNIYNGTITTDANGEATVTLPDWFEALNQDFRYQLTVIGTLAQAIVAEEIKDNRFLVRTSVPNVKVSWQVTGIRHDAYANKHRIQVEEQKPEEERGLFLHPDAFNKGADKGVQSIRVAPKSKN